MSVKNLERLLNKVDKIDYFEGCRAYANYNFMIGGIADEYNFPFTKTVAAFCALSPNSDYFGNLRSLVSVLSGLNGGIPYNEITVSTYKHCRDRAISYLLRKAEFDAPERGLKTLNFYKNILHPRNVSWVTIDGHMVAAYRGEKGTMSQMGIGRSEYEEIANCFKELAYKNRLIPNQLQAMLWFTRKRTEKIVYNPNLDLLYPTGHQWKIVIPLELIKPYDRATLERPKVAELSEEKFQMQMQCSFLPDQGNQN